MIVTFGETMLRLSPPGHRRFLQADSFDCWYGGAESNCAVALAQMGTPARVVTVLPDNPLGQGCRNELRRWGVDVDFIRMDSSPGARLGLYFCENGVAQRPSQVVYDRANSSFSCSKPGDYDWNVILQDTKWFHFTGITPALGENLRAAVQKACQTAKEFGVQISCDLNYRSALWSREEASRTMKEYLPYVDLLIANGGSAYDVLGMGPGFCSAHPLEDAASTAKEIAALYKIPRVAMTVRTSHSASRNGWQAILCEGKKVYISKSYELEIEERIGGGDSFAAGLLDGLYRGKDPQYCVELAAAVSCLKHTVPGDAHILSRAEAEGLIESDTIMPRR